MAQNKNKYALPTFYLSVIFLVTFFLIIFFYIWPQISALNEKKAETKKIIDNYEQIRKKWISYTDFISLKSANNKNLYLSSLYSKIDKNFFDKQFINNDDGVDFDSFYNKKVKEIKDLKSDPAFKSSQDSYKNILPAYIDAWQISWNWAWFLTDLKFASYIESILYTFNLSTSSKKITIWDLKVLKEYWTEKKSSIDTNIYYIPFSFDVSWKKTNIIDFLYFLWNVWSISVDENDNINFAKDNFINKQLSWFPWNNILENQIADIESIEFLNEIYLNEWLIFSWSVIDHIKRSQWEDYIWVKINARFYVKSIPDYKVMEAIENLTEKFNTYKVKLQSELNDSKTIKSQTGSTEIQRTIEVKRNSLKYLIELEKEINEIKKQKKDLEKVYIKVLEINKTLDYIIRTTW